MVRDLFQHLSAVIRRIIPHDEAQLILLRKTGPAYLYAGAPDQRLAEQARDAAVERQRSAEVESSVELLRTISDVLDLRTVFPRVSEIAKKMLASPPRHCQSLNPRTRSRP